MSELIQLDLNLAVSAISALFSAIAVIIASFALIKQARSSRFVIFDSSFNKILELEKELFSKYESKNEEDKKNWDDLFFNSVEFLAFFANEKYLDDKKMLEFFEPAIVYWYENIYLKHYSKEEIEYKGDFKEMKKLYNRIVSSKKDAFLTHSK